MTKFNGVLSFHGFPTELELRRQWLVKIRRNNFTISSHSKVCSRHFATDQLIEPKTLDGRRKLVKGAVPTLFEWNHFTAQTPRASVWERRERPTEPVSREEQEEHIDVRDHDYCSTPEPASLDMSSQATEDNSKTVEDLQKQLQELRVQREFCLQRFAGSDDNIQFYTRFPSYNHLMAFWFLIEPSIYKMVRVTRAISAAKRNEEVVTHARPSTQNQMPAYQVRETQAIARLRVHVERVIRRIKENKLFDGVILLSHAYNINQLFAVACMLSNYQNKALVKKWVK
ncbi:hypothetical protein JOQ06_029902 [Pogonophryne albipinna]|uniref:THAP-type domain-containing protein n=1 Tax=Pogonophryne albipinna TaxID=1090488 RepID=A0AAD6AW01_9TELE|nr:hypothetical protein JOQ06_029902 [Pogonophryne albipinna]